MKITLTQYQDNYRSSGWLYMYIETETVCTTINTSSCFDPYHELYIWLGQIRDAQLPAKMIIDEEGHGVELIADPVDDPQQINFRVEPWWCGDDTLTRIDIVLTRDRLIQSFCQAIAQFMDTEYDGSQWDLSYINWNGLLSPPVVPQPNWKLRLAMYGGGIGRCRETNLESLNHPLTPEQEFVASLRDTLFHRVTFLLCDHPAKVYQRKTLALLSLHREMFVDIALQEFDPTWYQKQLDKIDQAFGELGNQRDDRYSFARGGGIPARLSVLELGQVVDGTVIKIKPYGAFVDIGGLVVLLHITNISQVSVNDPNEAFTLRSWVRGIIIWMDKEKGRVNISTSDLEPEPGDMLKDPLAVYAKAEEMAERYRQNVLEMLQTDDEGSR